MLKSPVHTPKFHLHLHAPRLGWKGRIVLAMSVALSIFLIGFALFVAALPAPFTTVPPGLQGLAVFTGGSGRVGAALDLAAQGFSGPVLISGRHPQARLADILSLNNSHLTLTEAQSKPISMDGAQTTIQNIQSLKVWAAKQHIRRIGVITSTYHAARVEVLGKWLAPELEITILAVQPQETKPLLLAHEYLKLLAAPFLR